MDADATDRRSFSQHASLISQFITGSTIMIRVLTCVYCGRQSGCPFLHELFGSKEFVKVLV